MCFVFLVRSFLFLSFLFFNFSCPLHVSACLMSTSANQNMHIECWCCRGSGCQIVDVGGFDTIPDCSMSFMQSACTTNFLSKCPYGTAPGLNQPVATCPSGDGSSSTGVSDDGLVSSSSQWYESAMYIGIICGGVVLLTLLGCVSYYYSTRQQTSVDLAHSNPPHEPTLLV